MIDASSRMSGAFSDSSVIKLFQSASVSQQSEAGFFSASVVISGKLSGPAAQAIESIMQIVMNANGDTTVTADTDADVGGAETGSGNDTISVNARRAYMISSGGGNDTISIQSSAEGGRGHKAAVLGIDAGSGNDTVDIKAKGNVGLVFGGEGNDTISIRTDGKVGGVAGGDGNDTINIEGQSVAFVNGGEGNDTISITAGRIDLIAGGSGNDTVNITNMGEKAAQYYYFQGDGNDTVTSNGPVEFNLFSEDGSERVDMKGATWTQDGNTVTIALASGNTINVEMKDAANASVTYDAEKGTLTVGPAAVAAEEAENSAGTVSAVSVSAETEVTVAA
jgi:Ca2+-binding RTX toxin-like protein